MKNLSIERCRACDCIQSIRDRWTYGSRCEDCWADEQENGSVKIQQGPGMERMIDRSVHLAGGGVRMFRKAVGVN